MDAAEKLMARMTYTGPLPPARSTEPTKHPLADGTPGVRSTSRQALKSVDLNDKQRKVRMVFAVNPSKAYNNQEIADLLGWKINQVTGRVRELMDMGRIEEAYRKPYAKTGRRVIHRRFVKWTSS